MLRILWLAAVIFFTWPNHPMFREVFGFWVLDYPIAASF